MKALFALAPLALVAAAPVNWATTARQAPSGAIVLGNPAAKVKFVEYLSFTCSHCAHFVDGSKLALKRDYVAKGAVSVEVRNAVRDRYDFTAALLARCGGPARFYGNVEAIMAAQPAWMEKGSKIDAATTAKMQKLPINDSLKIIANSTGLTALMAKRGITAAQSNACLTNKAEQDKIVAMTNEAWNVRKINGTPAFLINNDAIEAAPEWSAVEPQIKAALAAK